MTETLPESASCLYDCGCKWVHTTPTQSDVAWVVVCGRHAERREISTWVPDDGGRAAAGFRGQTGDCVTRSLAIVSGLPYRDVYDDLNEAAQRERPRNGRKRSSARTGVRMPTVRRYLASLGYEWTPTMAIGSGCKVHLCAGELPAGRLIVQVTKHITAMIDGMIHDTHDPSRGGTRCVYGYWSRQPR